MGQLQNLLISTQPQGPLVQNLTLIVFELWLVFSGQLDQITGKGTTGTFQLVDGAAKTGTQFEDAVEDAIIASTEPKECSFAVNIQSIYP